MEMIADSAGIELLHVPFRGAGPAPIASRLREAMAQVMTSPDVLKTFEASGSLVADQDAPAFSEFVAADSARRVAAVEQIGRVE